jgi:hypothetical protein
LRRGADRNDCPECGAVPAVVAFCAGARIETPRGTALRAPVWSPSAQGRGSKLKEAELGDAFGEVALCAQGRSIANRLSYDGTMSPSAQGRGSKSARELPRLAAYRRLLLGGVDRNSSSS